MFDVHLISVEHSIRRASVGVGSRDGVAIPLFRMYPTQISPPDYYYFTHQRTFNARLLLLHTLVKFIHLLFFFLPLSVFITYLIKHDKM